MSYLSEFNGIDLDTLLEKGSQIHFSNSGWVKLISSETAPLDINTLTNPGNFTIDYITNGPSITGPFNLMVNKSSSNEVVQCILSTDTYARTIVLSPLTIGEWKLLVGNESILYSADGSTPTGASSGDILFSGGTTPGIKLSKGNDTWEEVNPGDMMKISIYDPTHKAQDFYTYVDAKIATVSPSSPSGTGITWTQTTMPVSEIWISVCYGNGKYVAVAMDTNRSAYSTDGITWTSSTLPSTASWQSVCYGNGNYVAITVDNNISAYSTDGITWTSSTLPSSQSWYSVCYGNGKYVAITVDNNISAYSTDGITWTSSTLPSSTYWISVCYGNGKFVTISQSNISAYSTDGIVWTSSTLPSSTSWYSVCYGNGKYVAITVDNNISAYSTDGITWTSSTLPSSQSWWSVCYGNGKYVTVASSSNISAYSTDGITWTSSTLPASKYWISVCYGNDKFVTVTDGSNISAYAEDAEATVDFSGHINDNSRHISSNDKNSLNTFATKLQLSTKMNALQATLLNEVTTKTSGFSDKTETLTTNTHALETAANSHFSDATIHPTTEKRTLWNSKADSTHTHLNDGRVKLSATNISGNITLSLIDQDALEKMTVVASTTELYALTKSTVQNGDSVYVNDATTPELYYVIDDSKLGKINITWTQSTLPSSAVWFSICYGNGKYVTVASDTNISAYSIDGITWTQSTMPISANWLYVCYGNGKYVAVAYGTISAYSTDGITWTQSTMPSSQYWFSVCYGNGIYVAVASSSNISAYSTDGITWTQTTLPSNTSWQSVCYGNGKYVAIANDSNISAYSTDGITWTSSTLPSSQRWYSVCYGNGIYVAVASSSNISAYSTDGITWIQTTLPSNTNWLSVCYGNGKYVTVAFNSNISAYSTDGIVWTSSTLPSSQVWTSVCYSNGKYVTVAFNSNISAYSTMEPPVYEAYKKVSAASTGMVWGNIQNKPTTIEGYGITDLYVTADIDAITNPIQTKITAMLLNQTTIDNKMSTASTTNLTETVSFASEVSSVNGIIDLINGAYDDPESVVVALENICK